MRQAEVSLREVTAETVRAICDLTVAEAQRGFVAPNAVSIAQAYFAPRARFLAIYADDDPVGFLMWRPDEEPRAIMLWRLMVDAGHQGRGYGAGALRLLMSILADGGADRLRTSYVPGPESPRAFYAGLGFAETGEVTPKGERVMQVAIRR